jgi:hypothetical protein
MMYVLIIVIAMQTTGLGGGGTVAVTSQVVGRFKSLDECKAVVSQPHAWGGSVSDVIVSANSGANWYNCGAIPAGPARTDCYIGLSRVNEQKSEIAVSTARQQTNSATYQQLTGSRPKTKRHRDQ